MNSPFQHQLSIHYDGQQWQAMDEQHHIIHLSLAEDETLPTLPDGSLVHSLLLPAEQLLSRTFQLPLSSPRFIDQDMLGQELEEHSSESADSWWLAWQAATYDGGVAGIMFGLPESLHQQITTHPSWQGTPYIASDIWLRLNDQLESALNENSELTSQAQLLSAEQSSAAITVFDSDSSGLFFGIWQPPHDSKTTGLWLAMRRLNWLDAHNPCSYLVEDIKRSLRSMNDSDKDTTNEHSIAIGRLSSQLHAMLKLSNWHGQLCDANALPNRSDATISASGDSAASSPASNSFTSHSSASNRSLSNRGIAKPLNFRHGRWRAGSHLNQFKPWYRSMAWAAMLMLLWSANMMWQNHQLQAQISNQQHAITAAFHLGLPHEPVIIDALAQLRKAAGGTQASPNSSSLAAQWLRNIEDINQVYKATPWTIRELSFQQGVMSMSGQTTDLQRMNRIQKALQQKSGKKIQIQDTDLSHNHVRFKMSWL